VAVAYRSGQATPFTAAGSFTANLGTEGVDWQPGDYAWIIVFISAARTIATPAGWTLWEGLLSGGSDLQGWVFGRLLVTGDASPLIDPDSTNQGVYIRRTYSGVDATTPVLDTSIASVGSGVARATAAMTTLEASHVMTAAASDYTASVANFWTVPAGFANETENQDATDFLTASAADMAEASAITGKSYTWTGAFNDITLMVAAAMKPSAGAAAVVRNLGTLGAGK
jgi:hypothetical protein